ncbi:MAG: hypothetical protein E5V74_19655, partial [Mesorhizobium sp.]
MDEGGQRAFAELFTIHYSPFTGVPMPYQSPISPGRSWYEDTVGPRPEYPPLDGDRACDVVIVGG